MSLHFSPKVAFSFSKQLLPISQIKPLNQRLPIISSALQKEFERKKNKDPLFAKNAYEQLDWIHKQSDHYEKAHLRYPILRIGD